MSSNDPLRDALRTRADQLGDTSPLTLDDIKGRARGIRRRRAAVTGLAAAAVVAVAVPMGLAVTDGVGTDPEDPPVAGPSVTPSAELYPGVKDGVLTTDVDAESYAPTIPYLYDGEVTLADGQSVPVEGEWDQLVLLGDEAVVVADAGRQELQLIGLDGTVTATYPSNGQLAGSADGSLVLYATPEGRLGVLTESGDQQDLPAVPQVQTPVPVAISGSDSCDPEVNGGCVAYVIDVGEQPASYSLTSKGIITPLRDYRTLRDVSADGWVSGIVSVDDLEASSCSAVRADAFDGRPVWSTCDHTVDTFSPDSSLVLGRPEYLDGPGDGTLALLDATDGSVLAEWTNDEETQAFVGTTAWDDDGTLLATVFQQGSWSLMRFGPDGGLSKVQDLDGGDDVSSPLVLGRR